MYKIRDNVKINKVAMHREQGFLSCLSFEFT